MVEWGGLENRCGLWATVGSNPTLSAESLSESWAICFKADPHTGSVLMTGPLHSYFAWFDECVIIILIGGLTCASYLRTPET